MWPFRNQRHKKPIPTVRFGGYAATWMDASWCFSDSKYNYTLHTNDCLDVAIADLIPVALEWINDLKQPMDAVIEEHVGSWSLGKDDREIISIDVSELVEKQRIEVSFGCDQWADYGIYVEITDGHITDSYGAD